SRDAEKRVPSAPVLKSVKVVNGVLVAEGSGIQAGALLMVDGRMVRDAKARPMALAAMEPGVERWRVASPADWKAMMAGGSASVTVLNPDGASSPSMTVSVK